MLCEVQGLESEQAERDVEALLRGFEIVSIAGDAIAAAGARNFRYLRRRGITVRKPIDLFIGTGATGLRPLIEFIDESAFDDIGPFGNFGYEERIDIGKRHVQDLACRGRDASDWRAPG